MSLVSQIVEKAFRELNAIGELNNITPTQATEGLDRLQNIVDSCIGGEVGDQLISFPIGRNNIVRPQGFPWYDGVPDNAWFVPPNNRVMLNLTSSVNLYLNPLPGDGERFALIDVSKNTSTFPVVIYGNGRTIENGTSITISTDGTDSQWWYRADLGNWQKVSPLVESDEFPFANEFDNYFITMLAMDLSPAYGAAMNPSSIDKFKRSRSQLTARYAQIIQVASELGLLAMPRTTQDRYWYRDGYYYGSPNDAFNIGRGYPWW